MALSLRQKRFVLYYLGKAEGNGTLAATLAGFSNPAVAAYRLIRNDKVIASIASRLEKAAMDADETLIRISRLAAVDAGDFLSFDPDSDPGKLPSLDLRKAKRRDRLVGIKKLKAIMQGDSKPGIVEVELHDALKALALLAKYHGLLDREKADAEDEGETIPPDLASEMLKAADAYVEPGGPGTHQAENP